MKLLPESLTFMSCLPKAATPTDNLNTDYDMHYQQPQPTLWHALATPTNNLNQRYDMP